MKPGKSQKEPDMDKADSMNLVYAKEEIDRMRDQLSYEVNLKMEAYGEINRLKAKLADVLRQTKGEKS